MIGNGKRLMAGFVTACFLLSGMPAHAGMIQTEQLANAQVQRDARADVNAFLARADVQKQMIELGVAPEKAEARVASLSESEVQQLAQTINDQPAGGDILVVVGIVFVVLLILELVGVTDIFKSI